MANVKAYSRVNWAAYPSKTTPMSASNFNVMDKGIDDLDDAVVSVKDRLDTAEGTISSQGSAISGLSDKFDALTVYTTPESCAIGATTSTIQNVNILTTSIIENILCENTSGTPIAITSCVVTTGQAVLSFGALTEATSFRLHVVNLS